MGRRLVCCLARQSARVEGAQDISSVKNTFWAMLRRLYNTAVCGTTSSAETAAVEQLAASHRQLLLEGSRAEVRSEEGYSACTLFLSSMESTARTMDLEVAPRTYRKAFSANYRALFPDDTRHYRVDVLEASADQHSAIWVNGDKFELSPEAICQAEVLQQAWSDLSTLLENCCDGTGSVRQPPRDQLASILVNLDFAWAGFENKYISELIGIEEQARRLIIDAVNAEARLGMLEDKRGSPEFGAAQQTLVRCIAHLNSVANFRRKGRDDLGSDILESALVVLEHQGLSSKEVVASAEGNGMAAAAVAAATNRSAGVSLAIDVVASFEAARRYLREVSRCLERVDPHLCNNVGLVARLVDWEESWEVGSRYVRQAVLLNAICDLVAEFRIAQRLAPSLAPMCADCDVELFLVLPRILLLCCLAEPTKPREGLLRSLLPHRFEVSDADGQLKSKLSDDPEMKEFQNQFKQTISAFASNSGTCASTPESAWILLVRRAVSGNSDDIEDGYKCLPQALQQQVRGQVESLMRDVEGCSLEIQRHCPEDWNQCSAVLIQCIAGGSQRKQLQPGGKFQV
ncbi:unnamed protein product [Polarella glacialis]|uniref:Uncharacterized protein n=1 Tax=Polarella glacialis TaxID=89957 RepID=A0A813EUP9_POLGL|nr:unnamed protein product [Polarella glacialis]